MKQMVATQKKVEGLNFYKRLLRQLKTNADLQAYVQSVRGSCEVRMPLVMYGLGSLQYSFTSKLWLSLALLLKRDFPDWIEAIEVCNPSPNTVEDRAIEDLGGRITIDQQCKGVVDRPTLFFMPYVDSIHLGNFFEANWCPSRLGKVVLLMNSLKDIVAQKICERIEEVDGRPVMAANLKLGPIYERLRYVWAIQKHAVEFEIDRIPRNAYNAKLKTNVSYLGMDEEGRKRFIDDRYKMEFPFAMFNWHFFKLHHTADMEALLPSIPSNIKLSTDCKCDSNSVSCWHKYMDGEDVEETSRLKQEIIETMEELAGSEFYHYIRMKMKDPEMKEHIYRTLGFEEHFVMVIYGLNSMERDFATSPHHILALALLFKEDSLLPINEIEVYPDTLNPTDCEVLSEMGCKVVPVSDRCRRKAERPTIFFISSLESELVGNLFEANLCSSRLNRMVVLGPELKDINQRHIQRRNGRLVVSTRVYTDQERTRFERATSKYTRSYRIDNLGNIGCVFSPLIIRFYDIEDNVDLRAQLPYVDLSLKVKMDHRNDWLWRDDYTDSSIYLLEDGEERVLNFFEQLDNNEDGDIVFEEHRRPWRARRTWQPPPPGWIKLNYAGIDKEGSSGYGGVFRNEHGERLLWYGGPVDGSAFASSVKALKCGIICLDKYFPDSDKLIVEGDCLTVMRWTNGIFPHPRRFEEDFDEIFDIIDNVRSCAVLHVCDEANAEATLMAIRGAEFTQFKSRKMKMSS